MYLLGHLGIGLGTAWLVATKGRHPVDYRLALLGAILPDLIDKPLGAALGLESRLWGHTLVFLAAVLVACAVPSLRSLVAVALGVATHLVLDRIWEVPWVLLWPAFGLGFPPDETNLWNLLQVLVSDPIVIGGEIAGATILLLFARAHGIRSWASVVRFLREGIPAVPGPADA
jgi:hypothetical protein